MPRPRLLFVHGRGQGEFDARDLFDLWFQSLSIGIGPMNHGVLKDADIDLPFYGARLDELLRKEVGLPQFPRRHREHGSHFREFEHFQHAHVREVQERHGLTNENWKRWVTSRARRPRSAVCPGSIRSCARSTKFRILAEKCSSG